MPARCSVASAALVGTLIVLVAACNNTTSPTSNTKLANGIWGAQYQTLTVMSGGASFESSCARGSIEQPVTVDRTGHFDVPGTYLQQFGGPSVGVSHPARYAGSTDGRVLNLTVRLTDTQQTLGPYVLTLGQVPPPFLCALV